MAWIEARIKRSSPLPSFIVTYYNSEDVSIFIEKELPQGADCIAEAPTATMPGYTFVGWREDSEASSDVLSSLTADRVGIYLYAVFKQTITVTLEGGDSPVSNTGIVYYNNMNAEYPYIKLSATSKSGWTLVGYSYYPDEFIPDDYAGNEYEFVENTTLYSVFEQTVTVTILGGDSPYTESETKYCNGTNIEKASIWLDAISTSQPEWELVGYRTDTTPNPDNIPYFAYSTYEFENNITLYAVFKQEVQLIVTAAGVENTITDYVYHNNGNIKKAKPTFADPTLSDADFKGYSTSDTSTTIAIATLANGIEIEQTTYYYAVWKWHDGTIYDGPEIAHGGTDISHSDDMPPIIYDMYSFDGTKYESVVVTMTAELHPGGSHQQNPGWVDLVDQDMVVTCREYYDDHIPGDPTIDEDEWWWHPLYATTGEFGTDEFGPCADRATGTIICNCPNTNPYTLQGSLGGWIVNEEHTLWNGLGITKIVGTGRTIVY